MGGQPVNMVTRNESIEDQISRIDKLLSEVDPDMIFGHTSYTDVSLQMSEENSDTRQRLEALGCCDCGPSVIQKRLELQLSLFSR